MALSISHFGMMDTSESAHLPYRAIRVFAHGVMPILVIATAHSKETAEIFLILIQDDASELIYLLNIATPIWALIVFWLFLFQGVLGRRAAIEIGILTIILTLLPPLWGFALYFCDPQFASLPEGNTGLPTTKKTILLDNFCNKYFQHHFCSDSGLLANWR